MADTLTLLSKTHLTDNIWCFVFKSHPSISWTAGQFIRVELPHNHPDAEGTKRWFTVSAPPSDTNPMITTRITDTTFKQALVNLPEGGKLSLLERPDGDFIWEDSGRALVFVAAGIGITPFHSILAERAHNHEPIAVTLVCGNRTEAVAFKDEFDQIAAAHPDFKIHYVTGAMLTAAKLADLVPDLMKSLVYVSGPEPMVEALGDQLTTAGLPAGQLKQDFFPNYDETQY